MKQEITTWEQFNKFHLAFQSLMGDEREALRARYPGMVQEYLLGVICGTIQSNCTACFKYTGTFSRKDAEDIVYKAQDEFLFGNVSAVGKRVLSAHFARISNTILNQAFDIAINGGDLPSLEGWGPVR